MMRALWRTIHLPALTVLVAVMSAFVALATAHAQVDADWRIHIRDAAVVAGDRVLLGEIAEPVGKATPRNWKKLAAMPLWSAPPRPGQPMTISRHRLRKELAKYIGETADLAIYPASIAIQQGGKVVRQDELNTLIVSSLTRYTSSLEGEVSVRDMQLPQFVFLRDRMNRLEMEPPSSLAAGQFTIRLREVTEAGDLVRRITGGATLDQWVTVPCAAAPLNRFDSLSPESVTFARKNLAYLNGDVWNGKGGPWRVLRSVGAGSVIYQSDLEMTPMLLKGSKVDLIYEGRTLRLSVPAQAMADGKPGELVPVRNLQSKKEVYATVRDATTVVIKK
ncbi:flagellar basal body P-ring formation chaperone FlgA [Desulfovibrio mangrovi]|uniref:flagellar basal body P-ring formation chaperone FlgA n=1 Tax=Desulfovibrio mangrovi TaxID=2976983 RepID=UPI002246AE82|nr:flagellar basal body P-ring formation chaperone FlgA [Desulfovibrio mangrovi]UZP67019.1 flagellar basal body P-ring formation chaperone FlgA [Desulfovibrio mangrovi]